jgi:hypothetical protein
MASQNIRNLLETITIMENYDNRIISAANILIDHNGKNGTVSKEDVLSVLKKLHDKITSNASSFSYEIIDEQLMKACVELRSKNTKTFKDTVHDILGYMVKNRMITRASSTRSPYYVESASWDAPKIGVSHQEINDLGMKMMNAAGDAFPDGDPNDAVTEYIARKGWDVSDAYDKLVPVAARKVLGVKSYSEYLANMWDEYNADFGASSEEDYNKAMDAWVNSDLDGPEPRRREPMMDIGDTNPWK